MRRLLRRRDGDRGITLVELAVAILVLSLGSIAALRAADQSQRAITGELPRILARTAAYNRAQELRLFGRAAGQLPRTVTLGGQSFTLTSETQRTAAGLTEATVTARSAGGEGAQLVVYLPGGAAQ